MSNGEAWLDPELIADPVQAIGGGMRVTLGSSALLESDTAVHDNVASTGGGVAVLDSGSSLTVNGANIHDNNAHLLGAGLYVREGSVNANNLQVQSNSSPELGGGIAVLLGGSIEAMNTTIADNTGTNGSGGLYLLEGSATFTEGSVFSGNSGGTNDGGDGGAIYCNDSMLSLQNVHFEDNYGTLGGAIYVTNLAQDLVISDCTFLRNTANNAGAIYARDLTKELRVEYCVMAWNDLKIPSQFVPTAVYSQQDLPGGVLSLVGCTIANNEGGMGAITHRSGLMNLTESVVAFNSPAGITGNDLGFVQMSCNDFWSNGEFDYGVGAIPGAGSFSEDPQFCDPDNEVYTVNSTSPLLPAGNDCAIQIGALGQGCSVTP
jgi:predicted outer membrane repeat protein